MAKRRRVSAQLVLVVFCVVPRLALGQTLADPLQISIPSDMSDTAVSTDLYPTPDDLSHSATDHETSETIGCPDCGDDGRRLADPGRRWHHRGGVGIT